MTAQPYLIRISHAPKYLGMSKSVFNELIRPRVSVAKVRSQGFVRREELERAAEETLWPETQPENTARPASTGQRPAAVSGASTKPILEPGLSAALAHVRQTKPTKGSTTKCSESDEPRCLAKANNAAGKKPLRVIYSNEKEPKA